MTALRKHVIAVVAALFALAVGIALGGGPLSYAPEDDAPTSTETPEPDDEVSEDPGGVPAPPDDDAYADEFAAAAAPALYDAELLGHPTAVVAMPGVDPATVEAMVAQVAAAGGGLTGIFEVSADAVDAEMTTEVDTATAALMTQLGDSRIDPEAATYTRLGQLLGVAIATPDKGGQRSNVSSDAIRTSLGAAGLLTADPEARLAPVVLVLLPESESEDADPDDPDDPDDTDEALAATAIYTGLTTGLRENAAGAVVLGDTESGDDGLLADLRTDPLVTSALATVDGGDTVIGQVTAMLAVISALDGSVGAYGASGSDGAVPIS